MIPRLESIEAYEDLSIWMTTDGVCGVTVEIGNIDSESESSSQMTAQFSAWMKTLEPSLTVKIETKCTSPKKFPRSSRIRALETLGAKEYRTLLSIQTSRNLFLELVYKAKSQKPSHGSRLHTAIQNLNNFGIEFKALDEKATSALFISNVSKFSEHISRIDSGNAVLGALRLYRQTPGEVDNAEMAYVLRHLPPPYRIVTSFKRIEKSKAELFLQKRMKQEEAPTTERGRMREEAFDSALAKSSFESLDLFDFELTVIFERSSERDLREALSLGHPVLQTLGDVVTESVGVAPTYVGSLQGSGMHISMMESECALPLFLPIHREGETISHGTGLPIHRRDGSLGQIDILKREHQNANAVIVGASGRGKSAFLGCLTESLLSDPNVRMIKVDVGGSHSNECEMMNGKEYRLGLESTYGINPLSLIRNNERESEAVRSIVSQFIEQLILEEGEQRLPKTLRAEVDERLRLFLLGSEPLSIDGLVADQEFPRRELLARFGGQGLYGRAFRSGEVGEGKELRLRYFNFGDVSQASDPDFAQAAMAAVLAVFNLEVRRFPDFRHVLVCDETPFFIERCFEFFKLSTANVRKFGGSVILAAQVSSQLIVNDDTGILENSHHRFSFSSDGSIADFQERFKLTEKQLGLLQSLQFRSKEYSECLYQLGENAKVCRLRLSPEEYWRVSSNQNDRLKLKTLRQAVPELSALEAIRVLSIKEALIAALCVTLGFSQPASAIIDPFTVAAGAQVASSIFQGSKDLEDVADIGISAGELLGELEIETSGDEEIENQIRRIEKLNREANTIRGVTGLIQNPHPRNSISDKIRSLKEMIRVSKQIAMIMGARPRAGERALKVQDTRLNYMILDELIQIRRMQFESTLKHQEREAEYSLALETLTSESPIGIGKPL